MNDLQSIRELRSYIRQVRENGKRIGFVPTMGALHEGHLSLVRSARAACDQVVVSIFVNPTQFGPTEDYDQYPRPIEADLAACRKENVDAVFRPEVSEMYPPGSATGVHVAGLTQNLCGQRHRPGHFDGVTTVVAKLFNLVQPDVAYFGQKDYQQSVIVRRMVSDMLWPIEIVVCPTVREPDGLALSSRNAYLSPGERRQAASLFASLCWARQQIEAGNRDAASLLEGTRQRLEEAGPCTIDYIEIVDAQDLTPKHTIEGRCVLALAVRIGPSRLIDNLVVDVNPVIG